MKRAIASLLVGVALLSAASHCRASEKPTQAQQPADKAQARAVEAQAKGQRVTIKLRSGANVRGNMPYKSGGSVSGKIEQITVTGLTITEAGPGGQLTASVDYSDIAEIKVRNSVLKVLKDIGLVTAIAVGVIVLLPVITAAVLYAVITGHNC